MLRVIAGRFHPSLETALIEQVRRAKAADPFAPLLVLVPSAPLLARVRKILTLDGQALLNIHFLTFHQLVLRLADERRLRLGRPPLRVVDEVFFQQLIKQIVKSRLSNLAPLQQIGQSSGTSPTARILALPDAEPNRHPHGRMPSCVRDFVTRW